MLDLVLQATHSPGLNRRRGSATRSLRSPELRPTWAGRWTSVVELEGDDGLSAPCRQTCSGNAAQVLLRRADLALVGQGPDGVVKSSACQPAMLVKGIGQHLDGWRYCPVIAVSICNGRSLEHRVPRLANLSSS